MRLLSISVLLGTLRLSDACSSFDGSSLTHLLTAPSPQPSITSGVTDARGIQAMLSRALGQQTHIGKTGQPIQLGATVPTHHTDWVFDANELACADFDENCRWKNVEGIFVDQMDWYQGSGFLDQGRLQVATGTHISPEGYYAIVASDHAQLPTDKAILVSDTVGCQIGPGELRLMYWSSPEVHLRVCTRKSSALLPTGYDYCSPPLDDPKPGPVRVALPDGGREPFQIFIIADNFVYQATSLQGGFAIIDEIEYAADMCGDEEDGGPGASHNSLGGTPFPKLVDLAEKEQQKGVVMKSSITRRGPLPVSAETREFIKTVEGGREDEEEEEDESAVGPDLPPLRPSKKFIPARENMSREDMRASRERPGPPGTRKPAGRSNGVDTDEVPEEEISLADFSAMSVDGSIDRFLSMMKESAKQQEQHSKMKSACDVLNCRFSEGDCVGMLAGSEWHTSDRPVGNPLTGIRGDASLLPYNKEGSFAYIRGPRPHSRLQTQPFHLAQDAFFIFAYHKIDPQSSFRVYAKQAGKEKETLLFDAPVLQKNSSRRWFREGRVLPAGDYDYIIFEVHSLSSNNYIGLDEILVLNVDRQLMCT